MVWGAVADKDHSDVMALLPPDAAYTWCAADIPRAMKGTEVAKLRPELGGEVRESPAEALKHCIEEGRENDVWVGGSLFVVGDALPGCTFRPSELAGLGLLRQPRLTKKPLQWQEAF